MKRQPRKPMMNNRQHVAFYYPVHRGDTDLKRYEAIRRASEIGIADIPGAVVLSLVMVNADPEPNVPIYWCASLALFREGVRGPIPLSEWSPATFRSLRNYAVSLLFGVGVGEDCFTQTDSTLQAKRFLSNDEASLFREYQAKPAALKF